MIELVSEGMKIHSILKTFTNSIIILSTGTRIRTLIKGFGDLYSTVELFP
jgi:hypothetical protein